MKVTARVNIELAKPTNYIPMGYWNASTDYYLSDLGIPFVKRSDGSTLGYSVFSLNVEQATKGSWIASEWRLIESAEFMYMQGAYIEHLQAELITAQKIESLLIKTGNLEVLHGAKVAGLSIEGDSLVTSNKRVVIDGNNNTIYLLDDNGKIKTLIRPNNIPATIAEYFSGSGTVSRSISTLSGNISTSGSRQSDSITLNTSGGKAFEIAIPQLTISTTTQYLSGGIGSSASSLRLYLTNGATEILLGQATAMSTGEIDQQSVTIPAVPKIVTTSGQWRIEGRLTSSTFPEGGLHNSSGSISSSATQFTVSEVVERSEIGSNGMMIATSNQNYNYMVGGLFQIRRGQYMIRVNSTGIEKSIDGGSNWTSL